MTFDQIKRLVRRFEPLIWDDEELYHEILGYSINKGEWQGKQESDDIWPIDPNKPSPVPWSDYQMEVYDNLLYKRKLHHLEVEKVASFYFK